MGSGNTATRGRLPVTSRGVAGLRDAVSSCGGDGALCVWAGGKKERARGSRAWSGWRMACWSQACGTAEGKGQLEREVVKLAEESGLGFRNKCFDIVHA